MDRVTVITVALIAGSYLLGSIPFGLLIARSKGIDIRQHGSKNIGATNVWRVMGKRFGLLCFALDFLKGLTPSVVAAMFASSSAFAVVDEQQRVIVQLLVAVACVLGHVFPVWLKFKGGKGVATSFGALVGMYPVFTIAAVIGLVSWLVSLKLSKMVGISSCIAAIVLVISIVLMHVRTPMVEVLSRIPGGRPAILAEVVFACVLASLVLITHRANIVRTFKGTENKIGTRGGAGAGAGAGR